MRLARRMHDVTDSITLAVSAKANAMKKAGIDVVGFGAGEPDFDTPGVHQGRREGRAGQGPDEVHAHALLAGAAKAIAEKFNRENGLPYKPEQITTGAGGKHCLYMAFMAVLNPGDEVHHPVAVLGVSYPEQVKLAGGVPKIIRGEEANGFKITPQQLEAAISPKTKVFVINSPEQPRRPRVHAGGAEGAGRRRRAAPET